MVVRRGSPLQTRAAQLGGFDLRSVRPAWLGATLIAARPDVVHLHGANGAITASTLAFFGAPFVMTLPAKDPANETPYGSW